MIAIRIRNDHGILRENIFRELPIRIGRSADCDFVILDDSVSKQHAVIERDENGQIVVRDVGSRNGLRVGMQTVPSVRIDQSLRCFLGLVEIEIDILSNEITRIVKAPEWHRVNRRRTFSDHVRIVLMGLLGAAAYYVIQPNFWSPTREDRGASLLWEVIISVVALPTFSLIYLLVLRALGRKLRIADTLQAFTNTIWINVIVAMSFILSYYLFSTSVGSFMQFLTMSIGSIIIVVYLAELRRNQSSWRFRLAWACSVIGLIVAFQTVKSIGNRSRGEPHTDYFVMVPLEKFVGSTKNLASYFQDIDDAVAAGDKEAEKARKKENAQP